VSYLDTEFMPYQTEYWITCISTRDSGCFENRDSLVKYFEVLTSRLK